MKALEKTLKSVSENPRYIFRLTFQGVLVGLFSGLMVCLYRWLLAGSEHVLRNYLKIINGNIAYTVLFFISLAILGILIDLIIKWERDRMIPLISSYYIYFIAIMQNQIIQFITHYSFDSTPYSQCICHIQNSHTITQLIKKLTNNNNT